MEHGTQNTNAPEKDRKREANWGDKARSLTLKKTHGSFLLFFALLYEDLSFVLVILKKSLVLVF